jgi:hypothetical protein
MSLCSRDKDVVHVLLHYSEGKWREHILRRKLLIVNEELCYKMY